MGCVDMSIARVDWLLTGQAAEQGGEFLIADGRKTLVKRVPEWSWRMTAISHTAMLSLWKQFCQDVQGAG